MQLPTNQSTGFNHREMARRANDRIRVFNPTSEDITEQWDGYSHVIPAKEEKVLPRYVAENYVTHLADRLLTEQADKKVAEENERLLSKGAKAMAKNEPSEQQAFEQPMLQNRSKRTDIINLAWLGIEEEYGMDRLPAAETDNLAQSMTESEKILGDIGSRRASQRNVESSPPDPEIEAKKSKLVKEVSSD